jgi:hypothetical protein
MRKIKLGKTVFDLGTLDELVDDLFNSLIAGDLQTVITPNLDMWFRIQASNKYDALIQGFTKVIPDGMPIANALTRLSGNDQSRVAGSDLLPSMISKMRGSAAHFCFVGGPTGVARKCSDIANSNGLIGSFLEAPMNLLGDAKSQEKLIMNVLEVDFDVLVLGFGFPLQELLCNKISKKRGRGIYLNVGMALLYLSGEKSRSPKFLQVIGLEWLFRLLSEPVRLFKRYVVVGPRAYLFLRKESRRPC